MIIYMRTDKNADDHPAKAAVNVGKVDKNVGHMSGEQGVDASRAADQVNVGIENAGGERA